MMELMSLAALDIGADRRSEIAKSTMHAARGHPAHISEPIEAAIEPMPARSGHRGVNDCWHSQVRTTTWQGNVG